MINGPLTQEDIEKEIRSRLDEPDNQWDSIFNSGFSRGFSAAAEWRINSVWHDCNDRSAATNNKDEVVLLLENGKLVEYEDNWEEYYSPVLKWAYKKDLLPNNKE